MFTALAYENFLYSWRSPAAPINNPFEHGELGQDQDVDAFVSYWIQLLFKQHIAGSHIAPDIATASSLWVYRDPLAMLSPFAWFPTCGCFLHALTTVCVCFPFLRNVARRHYDLGLLE